ncbi:hypothetical protein HN481_02860, partial [Candidatus Parcubacteria bacterium]|nr:hypothetical protein [Candidatus Parcubacteria bacterium]
TIMTSPAVYLNGEYGVMSFTFSDGSIEIEANSSENFRLICDFLPKEEDAPENLVIAIGFLEERDLSPKEAIKAIGTTTGTDLNVSPQFSVSNTLILL